MNTPAEDDLEDLALELGATVEYASGEVFNSAGNKSRRKSVEAKQVVDRDAVLVALLAQVVELVKRPAQVNVAPPNVVVNPSKVLLQSQKKSGWTFAFDRNNDGSIKSITAHPLTEKP